MAFLHRFFYEDGAAEGGTGGDSTPPDQTPPPDVTKAEFDPEFKELGYQSLDDVKAFLKAQKEANVSPEDKIKQANLDQANFLKYSVDNELLTVEDYTRLQELKKVPNEDLVFESFKLEYKEENPDATDEELRESFKSEYKLDHENEKTKARGLARLEKEANALKSKYETKYTSARESYTERLSIEAKIPDYNKFIDEQIINTIPDKLVLYKAKDGESEIAIDVELTKEDREEIGKLFKNPKTFNAFLKSGEKVDSLKESIQKKVTGYLNSKYQEKAFQKTWETAHGIGLSKGSNIGAENHFGAQQGKQKDGAPVISIEASNDKIREARTRVGR